MSIGPLEIGILLVIVLLLFGAKRIPEVGGSLGKGIRDFGRGIKGEDDDPADPTQIESTPTEDETSSRPTASQSSSK
jgi:sec-independent protein translocase protein TatA